MESFQIKEMLIDPRHLENTYSLESSVKRDEIGDHMDDQMETCTTFPNPHEKTIALFSYHAAAQKGFLVPTIKGY